MIKSYMFGILIDGQLSGEGYGMGSNAIDAFENGVENGTVIFPDNQKIEVVATSEKGLSIQFEAVKGL